MKEMKVKRMERMKIKPLVIDSEDEEMLLLYNLCGAEGHLVDSELSEFTTMENNHRLRKSQLIELYLSCLQLLLLCSN